MNSRISIKNVEPLAYKAMLGLEDYTATVSITPLQRELIKIRASQINGCAYCISMHTNDALKLGESEKRIFMISVWKESGLFSQEDKAILGLTEAVTRIDQGVGENIYTRALEILGEKKIAEVIMCVIAINAWNRIGVSTQMIPLEN